jgi:hypothetical protein
MSSKQEYRSTATLFFFFFLLLAGCNIVLGIYFNFPDILRESAVDRFNLFYENQGVIIPTYYLFAVSSILQLFMAVMMFHLTRSGSMLDLVAVTAGVLSGVFQILGFYRWVVLIPMLSDASRNGEASSELIYFLEKYSNTYFGMTVGEHLGSLFTGLWLLLLGITLLKHQGYDKKLSVFGMIAGSALMIQCFDVVVRSEFLSSITVPVFGLQALWVFIMAFMLLRMHNATQTVKVPLWLWTVGIIIYLSNVIPAVL